MSHPMSKTIGGYAESIRELGGKAFDHPEDRFHAYAHLSEAAAELDRLHAIVERLPKCVVCNTPCVPIEDDGPECELTTGKWTCSESCWNRAAEWGRDSKRAADEYIAKEARNAK